MGVIRRLAAAGVGVIYISHRMDEIRRVANSVSVMRDGRHPRHSAARRHRQFGDHHADARPGCGAPRSAGDFHSRPTPGLSPQNPFVPGEAILSRSLAAAHPRIEDVSLEIRGPAKSWASPAYWSSGRTELLRDPGGAAAGSGQATRCWMDRRYRPGTICAKRCEARYLHDTRRSPRSTAAVTLLGIDENLVMANWNGRFKLRRDRPPADGHNGAGAPSPTSTSSCSAIDRRPVQSQRRQPAESGDRQGAQRQTARPAARRADPRRRCRRERADLSPDAETGVGEHRRRLRVERTRGIFRKSATGCWCSAVGGSRQSFRGAGDLDRRSSSTRRSGPIGRRPVTKQDAMPPEWSERRSELGQARCASGRTRLRLLVALVVLYVFLSFFAPNFFTAPNQLQHPARRGSSSASSAGA